MDSNLILYIILGVISFNFILEKTLDYLNYKQLENGLPDELSGIYDEKEYNKSVDYQKTNSRFSFFSSTFSFIVTFTVIATGLFGWLDGHVKEITDHPIAHALLFFAIVFIASDLLNIPFSLYKTFVIEEKFGFNKITPKLYALDKVKGYVLGIVIGGIVIGLLLWLVMELGQSFWIYFWVFVSLFMLFVNMFYTSVIIPLFNKLTPLESGSLRADIEKYSQKVGFDLQNIFVIDGSKRSSKANAFFSGIGKRKKIVLYDTLIQNHSSEELVSILAHEVGHFKKKHVITGLVLSILQIGLILFILSRLLFNPTLSEALGGEELSIPLNLIAFSMLFSPISQITGIFMNMFSRKNEYEADDYAATTFGAQPLIHSLKKLSVNNLSNLNPHPAYVFVHYSHPPLLSRLRNLSKHG